MHFSLHTILALTFIGSTFAKNRELYIKYTVGVDRTKDITKVVSIDISEEYNSGLGSGDTIVGAKWRGTKSVNINFTTWEMVTALMVTARETLSRSGISTVAYLAEKTADMSEEPSFDEPCWHRIFVEKEECVSRGWLSSDYLVKFTIYDKIIFFVPVGAINEAISKELYGVANFHENTGAFYPATMVKNSDHRKLEEKNFSYVSYCAVGKMIALQYDKNRFGVPCFEQDAWEYYKISEIKDAFKLERVTK